MPRISPTALRRTYSLLKKSHLKHLGLCTKFPSTPQKSHPTTNEENKIQNNFFFNYSRPPISPPIIPHKITFPTGNVKYIPAVPKHAFPCSLWQLMQSSAVLLTREHSNYQRKSTKKQYHLSLGQKRSVPLPPNSNAQRKPNKEPFSIDLVSIASTTIEPLYITTQPPSTAFEN